MATGAELSSESKVQIKYCHELSEVVYEKGDADALCEAVERKGAHLKQSWPLSHGGSGCAALMALLPWDDTEVLVVAFRGTAVTVEWIEYLKGESGSGVFSMWLDTLNEIWTEQGTVPSSPTRLTMKESILNHFNESKPVWLTGHGKGGAVATTAAARLVCGKEAVESFSAGLPRLSVVTFNSPKALEPPFAEAYEEAFHQFGLRHQRIEHADDVMRELPVGLRHVGTQIEARSLAVELPDLDSSLFAAVSAHGLEVSEDDFDEDNNGNSDHDPRSPQPHHYAAQYNLAVEAKEKGTAPCARYVGAVPYTVVILGKTGVGKSTLGNDLLNVGVKEEAYKEYFTPGSGPESCTERVEFNVSADGKLAVVDTPGIPDTTPSKTLDHYDRMVEEVRRLRSINLLLFVACEGRTNPQQYAEYKTVFKRFNLLSCQQLLVCRQPDFHRRPSTQDVENKRAAGSRMAISILKHSEMDIPYILHMDGYGPEARKSLETISSVARSCVPVPVGDSLQTYGELKAQLGRLACRATRREALKEDLVKLKFSLKVLRGCKVVSTLGGVVGRVGRVVGTSPLSSVLGLGETATAVATATSLAAAAVLVYTVAAGATVTSNMLIEKKEANIRKVEGELADGSVDEGELQKTQKDLRELEALLK